MTTQAQSDSKAWCDALRWGLLVTILLRLVIGLIAALAWVVATRYISNGVINNPKIFGPLQVPQTFPGDALLGVWPRWDAVHYLNIAQLGYQSLPAGDSVFYPLYVIVTRLVADLLGGQFLVAGLIVSTVAAFGLFTCLYRLTDMFYGTSAARWAVLVLAIYPTALFLIAPFTESLFLFLTLAAFLQAYRSRWWLAGLFGFFASLTRGPGMFTSAAFAILAWQQWRAQPKPLRSWYGLSVLAGVLLPIAGGLTFIVWRALVGYPSITDILKSFSGLTLTDPITGLISGLIQAVQVPDITTTLEIVSAFLFIGLSIIMIRTPRWRKPDWIAYAVLNMGVFLSKRSFVASSLQSMARYVIILFPAFILIGDWLSRRSKRVQFVYALGSSGGLLILSVLYVLWVFIG